MSRRLIDYDEAQAKARDLVRSGKLEWEEFSDIINFLDSMQIIDAEAVQRWIPVSERLPENEEIVLVLAQRKHWKMEKSIPITSMAFYTDGKHNTEESDYVWNDLTEYIEEADAYAIPEGWWESVRYGEEFFPVDDFVTHWMLLPDARMEGSNA